MNLGPSIFVRFSPDGRWLASASARTVVVREVGVREPAFSARLRYGCSADFSPDSRSLLVKTTSGLLAVLGPLDGSAKLTQIDRGRGEGAAPRYSLCGRTIVDGSWSGQLVVLDAATGACLARREFPPDMLTALECSSAGGRCLVRHSPRATTYTGPPDPDWFSVWSLPLADQPQHIVRPGVRHVHSSALSVDGRVLALIHGTRPAALSLVDAVTGHTLRQTEFEFGGTGDRMAWGPAGVLAVVERHRVRIYSDELRVLGEVGLAYPCDVAFSPQGDLVAIGSWERGRLLPRESILG